MSQLDVISPAAGASRLKKERYAKFPASSEFLWDIL
jgi:hypothetical protein